MTRNFATWAFMGLVLVSCSGFGFPFKHYGLELPSYEQGKLLGPTADQDIPISRCKPDEEAKGKCVVLLADEFYRLKEEYLYTKMELAECQRGKP